MPSNMDNIKLALENLTKTGHSMFSDIAEQVSNKKTSKGKKDPGMLFHIKYQNWYSEALETVRQILPNRLEEFRRLYCGDGKRKQIDGTNFTIQDWMLGMRSTIDVRSGKRGFDDIAAVAMRFKTQLDIIESIKSRFESALFDIKSLVRADLFDSELETSRELLNNGFVRGSGAIAGVVIEKHLRQVCENHNVSIKKKNPTISVFNDALKNNDIINIPTWRFIQRLGDLRNLCDHDSEREPKDEDVSELIDGVEKISKTVF